MDTNDTNSKNGYALNCNWRCCWCYDNDNNVKIIIKNAQLTGSLWSSCHYKLWSSYHYTDKFETVCCRLRLPTLRCAPDWLARGWSATPIGRTGPQSLKKGRRRPRLQETRWLKWELHKSWIHLINSKITFFYKNGILWFEINSTNPLKYSHLTQLNPCQRNQSKITWVKPLEKKRPPGRTLPSSLRTSARRIIRGRSPRGLRGAAATAERNGTTAVICRDMIRYTDDKHNGILSKPRLIKKTENEQKMV